MIDSVFVVSLLFSSAGFLWAKKDSTVCYDVIGCFHNDGPFFNIWNDLPDSPEAIGVTFNLYTRANPTNGTRLDYKNSASVFSSGLDPKTATKMIIHGYLNDGTEDWIKKLTQEFLRVECCNVIVVAWGPGAHHIYPKAASNTRVVGAVAAHLLINLRDVLGVSMELVHIVGHSLGAHVAGHVGSLVPNISRISGLDPAGPLFENADPVARIDANDAIFVDCIHTDAIPIYYLGFGTMAAWCDVDFYPNGAGHQPGCPRTASHSLEDIVTFHFQDAEITVSCSHSRSHDYFINSMANCRFPAYPCANYEDFLAGKCSRCGGNECPSMGYHAIDTRPQGKFFLTTTSAEPFCSTVRLDTNTWNIRRSENPARDFTDIPFKRTRIDFTGLNLPTISNSLFSEIIMHS